jgi:hypothetical protein
MDFRVALFMVEPVWSNLWQQQQQQQQQCCFDDDIGADAGIIMSKFPCAQQFRSSTIFGATGSSWGRHHFIAELLRLCMLGWMAVELLLLLQIGSHGHHSKSQIRQLLLLE